MFKEAHTISYIQQVSHEWIEGNEEEIAYAQAIENLKVVPTNIQHGPKLLQRFKATHEPLVKTLSSFEDMESPRGLHYPGGNMVETWWTN